MSDTNLTAPDLTPSPRRGAESQPDLRDIVTVAVIRLRHETRAALASLLTAPDCAEVSEARAALRYIRREADRLERALVTTAALAAAASGREGEGC